jgi:GNAT superfamily N-acetyltransferase
MDGTVTFRLMEPDELEDILPLMEDTHPDIPLELLEDRLAAMRDSHYGCVGGYCDEQLVAVCGFWITTRFYCGKQLEVDNVAVDGIHRSKGIGRDMMAWVCDYARSIGCLTCELNTYVNNTRSHKFYMNEGFDIIGYHMEKEL